MKLWGLPVTALMSLSLAMPAQQAAAGNNLVKGLAVGVVGVGIYCGVTGNCTRGGSSGNSSGSSHSTSRSSAPKSSGVSTAQRQQNRDVQTALNAFGFPVGTVDGALGQRSRDAIGDYQEYMGYPRSGYLDDNQRGVLLNSYQRMQAGEGAAYSQVVAGEGTRGLLRAFNNPGYAAAQPQYPGAQGAYPPAQPPYGQAPVYGNAQPPYGVPAPTYGTPQPDIAPAPPYQEAAAIEPEETVPQAGGVVSQNGQFSLAPLERIGQPSISMAEHCEVVDLTTQTNQGVISAANMTDPDQALGEKFCEARSYTISVGQTLAANVRATEAQLIENCQQITGAMGEAKSALAADAPDAVTAKAAAVNARIGLSDPTAAATYGQVCLSLGYRQDDADMATTGALVMVGAGFPAYGEVLGHHLHRGFGVSTNDRAAQGWYETAVSALEHNAQPAFTPSKTQERIGVIRAALGAGVLQASNQSRSPFVVPVSAQGTIPAAILRQ